MKEVEFKYQGTVSLFQAQLDGKKLKFKDGKVVKTVRPDTDLPLQWFARGAPGTKYTIEITRPKEAKFSYSVSLDGHQKDAGVFWFSVGTVGTPGAAS